MASDNKKEQQIAVLQAGDVRARKEAARWLGRKNIGAAFLPLLEALKDSSWKVRRNAAIALGQLGNIEALEALIAALSDRTLSVKRAAISALGDLRDVRAVEALVAVLKHEKLCEDALKSLIQIGAPALLYCCQLLQNDKVDPILPRSLQDETPAQTSMQGANAFLRQAGPPQIIQKANPLRHQTVRQMILLAGDPLLRETMTNEEWSGRQRWLILETVRTLQSSLSIFEFWQTPKFSRIADFPMSHSTDIALWCERIIRQQEQVALHPGCRQVLDYIMLGRASQRDYGTESAELLRGASGTKERDTGKTLLRASDKGEGARKSEQERPSLLGRLRRWLG